MPRGLSSTITDALNATSFGLPIYCVRITRATGDVLRWAEQSVSFDDGSGTQSYEARLISISGLDFSPDQAGPVTLMVANVDGQVTIIERTRTFLGATLEILAYLPGIPDYYRVWYGWSDEVSEIHAETATLIAYPTVATPNVQVPKRVIGLPCTNSFANTANWVNARAFDGSECPYQRTSSVGFVAALVFGTDTSQTSVTIQWTSTTVGAGAKFQRGDAIWIGSERMLITNSPDVPDGSYRQVLTVTRAYRSTTAATHADNDTVFFANCGYSSPDCTRHGMYGNNPADSYSV